MTPYTITLEAGAWSEQAAAWLSQTVDTNHCGLADLRAQVDEGAQLLYARVDGVTVGAAVLRVDHLAEWSEGVIVAAAASLRGVNLIDALLPLIEGRFVGCRRVRFHTSSPAVLRRLAQFGYQVQEIVGAKEMRRPAPVTVTEAENAAAIV